MDQAVVARARAGDRGAMEELLSSIAPSIRRFALRMCRSEADADDVLQDALLSIATHLGDFEGRSSLPSWAFTLARSACARRHRGQKNRPHEAIEAIDAETAKEPDPEERTASLELAKLVDDALGTLPEEYREVLLLRDGEGLSAPEAALILGISVDALKSRLHRARSALRDVLRPVLEPSHGRSDACPDVVRALSRKLEDELDPDACAAMEKHVVACPACARTCDAVKDALRACRSSNEATLTPAIRAHVSSTIRRWLGAPT